MNRYKASATHLGISAVILGIFFSIVFFIWYPVPYFTIEGTFDVIVVLIGVDLILGPLLTLIVFKSGKPSLKFDLSVIAIIQISALIYGANTIYTERPYFIAFAVDLFTVIQANKTKEMDLSLIDSTIDYQHLGPSYIYAENPPDSELAMKISLEAAAGGADIDRHPELYRDFKKNMPQSFDRSLDLDTLSNQFPSNKAIIDSFRSRYPDSTGLAFYPLLGKNRDVVLVLNKNNLEIVDYIDLDPWQKIKKQESSPTPIPGLLGAPLEQTK